MPDEARTETAKTGSFRAPCSSIDNVITDCGGMTKPCKFAGVRSVSLVTNEMSTTVASLNGFVSTICSMLSAPVNPSAKYHSADGRFAHNVTTDPAG
ncbi:unannotated protein [freshwater metagenome]|uniref:Unannotated protein n=1 Tax=freshwater metagenome TaxID=449393 RepID=A0A6J7NIW1_9ZZZZ